MDIPIPWHTLYTAVDQTYCLATKLPTTHPCHTIDCSHGYDASPASRKLIYTYLGEFLEDTVLNERTDVPAPERRKWLVHWARNLVCKSHRASCINDIVDAVLDRIAMIEHAKRYVQTYPVDALFPLYHTYWNHVIKFEGGHCEAQHAPRRALEDCLICKLSLEPEALALDFTVWCRNCGHNYHRECWDAWEDAVETQALRSHNIFGTLLTCALCRAEWYNECAHEMEEPAGWRGMVRKMLQGEPRWSRDLRVRQNESDALASAPVSASAPSSASTSGVCGLA